MGVAPAALPVEGATQAPLIEVFPVTPYERLIIYENLIIFWLGIIGLVIIIRMKLREIDRTHKMGIDREEKDIPLLD
ncbi:MAG: hypothetical protein A4E62_02812 [Syntrophorhabdus sp. PtaU1.Bin002]|nr:MAG: hypothetical protein A4E62_02812 [Syntrophorhabdus sp. PtaU1.Bin002]